MGFVQSLGRVLPTGTLSAPDASSGSSSAMADAAINLSTPTVYCQTFYFTIHHTAKDSLSGMQARQLPHMSHLKVHHFHVCLEKRKLVGDVLHLACELKIMFFFQGVHRAKMGGRCPEG